MDLAVRTAGQAAFYSSPALANGRLYLGTDGGEVLCIGQ
jgi:hypothetical protein